MRLLLVASSAAVLLGSASAAPSQQADGATVARLPRAGTPLYPGHREPLLADPLIKLPVGSVKARGWLEATERKMADGMFGRLREVSRWCRMDGNAWASPTGAGDRGWEELPYWLRGFVSLAWQTRDERLLGEAKRWVEAILASQREDGWFGPESNRKTPDLWPNMLVCRALQTWFEATADPRIPAFLAKYFRWQTRLEDARFLPGSWQKQRGADNLMAVHWLYDRTGETWLLDLAQRTHARTSDWEHAIPTWHGVNLCQGFREPAQWYVQSRDESHLLRSEAIYREVYQKHGQVPGGMFGADENCRPGQGDPRQGTETCSMVEMMLSQELLLGITGDTNHADRCEDVAFNSLPAATTPDQKALHYLTAPNLVSCDAGDKHPGFENGGCMLAFSADERYRCCQHNTVMGWPYFAEHLWMATRDQGLAAVLYAPCEVEAKVAGCESVRIECANEYPFRAGLRMVVHPRTPGAFPLWLRVPGWCEGAGCSINGALAGVKPRPGTWLRIERAWSDGDVVELRLPMALRVQRWPSQGNAASLQLGPLALVLPIGERWQRSGGSDAWPDHEVLPTTEWRFALDLEPTLPGSGPAVAASRPTIPRLRALSFEDQDVSSVVRLRPLPAWGTSCGLVGKLQPSPVVAAEHGQMRELVPMGSARLRIAVFPVAGTGADARAWQPEPVPPKASHAHDDPFALSDGVWPQSSDDHAIPRFTWWDHKGTEEWVQYDFASETRLSECTVYWFDDAPRRGHCRVPRSWQLLVPDGAKWRPLDAASGYGVAKDAPQRVTFRPVTTRAIRLAVRLQDGWSGGVLEWECK